MHGSGLKVMFVTGNGGGGAKTLGGKTNRVKSVISCGTNTKTR